MNSIMTLFVYIRIFVTGKWQYNKAWEQFEAENQVEPFDVIHSESVALPHWMARKLPNLVASWHGIALESLQSDIYQDLALRPEHESLTKEFIQSVQGVIPKVLNEIRFFKSYAHHVAISDSCGEMLRDVYQIPTKRVHVILNGVDENDFGQDPQVGRDFRYETTLRRVNIADGFSDLNGMQTRCGPWCALLAPHRRMLNTTKENYNIGRKLMCI